MRVLLLIGTGVKHDFHKLQAAPYSHLCVWLRQSVQISAVTATVAQIQRNAAVARAVTD